MTDERDDESSGVPVRGERSESGRHVTNRNIVAREPPVRDSFDVITPVRPPPADALERAVPEPVPFVDPVLAPPSELVPDSTPPRTRRPSDPRRPVTGFLPDLRMPIRPASGGLPVVRIPDRPPSGPQPVRPPTERPVTPRSSGRIERPETQREPTEPGRAPTQSRNERLPVPVSVDRALRAVTVFGVFALGAAGLAQPTAPLRGGIAWLAFLFFVLSGWGTLVARALRASEPEPGQRIALGVAGLVAAAGPLVALGVLSRPVMLLAICAGFAGFAWREATAKVALWRRIRHAIIYLQTRPAVGAFVAALIALACVRMIGAVAALDRNPWDDELGYIPLIKRLLDTGDLVEPFSFHRLAGYGGQTVLAALAGARGTIVNVHLVDKGLGLGAVLLLVTGYARERRTQPVWLALIALVILLLPDTAISTAPMWLAAAGLVALYRAVAREQWAFAGVLAAGTAALRMPLAGVALAFLIAVLAGRLIAASRTMPVREAWQDDRRAWALSLGGAAALLVPWWIAALRASHTFAFPLLGGTWNAAIGLRPAGATAASDLAALVAAALETAPLVVIPLLAIVLAFVADHRHGRPLFALVIASLLGFVALALGFAGEDPFVVWRHGFGFALALTIVLALELGADDESRVSLAPLGRWIALAALVLQILVGRGALTRQTTQLLADVRAAADRDRFGDPSGRAEARRYAAMQAQIPAGAPVIVMVDEPARLDYRRNPIANLDTPGYASPGALPAFAGAEPLRAYLVARGYRYAAFVRSERSRYWFRRSFWLARLFTDRAPFQVMSAYALAAIDGFAELATTTTRRYDSDGLVVLDLASPSRAASATGLAGDEPARRAAWVRALADREGLHDAWALTSRADVRFADGAGALQFVDGDVDDPAWFDAVHPRAPAQRGTPVLPLARRVHLQVQGDADMHLALRVAIALNAVFTHPRLDVSLDGELITTAVADATGRYAIEATVPRARLAGGWHDLYLQFSSVAEPGRAEPDAPVARLEALVWAP
jgi:hypothetical protein